MSHPTRLPISRTPVQTCICLFIASCSSHHTTTGAGGAASGTSATTATISATSSSVSSIASSTTSTGGSVPPRVWGVTVDDVTNIAGIVGSLQKLPQKPTTRVVFDKGLGPADYQSAVQQIHAVSNVMGLIVDSSDVSSYTLAQYTQRAHDYMTGLGNDVDIWEIGNEINADPWLGPTSDVVPKMTGAYDIAKQLGKTTELTLYYNEGCYTSADHEMFTWAQANVPDNMKQGLDYVLISFYEDDCNGIMPDWPTVFSTLGAMFPNSKIGFGECGTTIAANKATYVDRYYRMKIDHPRWVGGDFWWYFAEDMVPSSAPLWTTLDNAMLGI